MLNFSFNRLDILFIDVIEFPGECSRASKSESTTGDFFGMTDFFLADRAGALSEGKIPIKFLCDARSLFDHLLITYLTSSASVLYSDSSASLKVSSVSPFAFSEMT